MKIATKILQAEAEKKYQAVLQKLENEKEEQALVNTMDSFLNKKYLFLSTKINKCNNILVKS